MNIPNRIKGKITLAPLNFHLARTNPLSEPSIAEMMEAGTTNLKELKTFGERASQAALKLSSERPDGRSHMVRRLTSSKLLNPVASMMYIGIR